MAKFYVGQRVRLARAMQPQNMGLTGTIREFIGETVIGAAIGRFGKANCCCDWDDGTRDGITTNDIGVSYWTHTDQLELLIKPDNEAGDWAELGFHPSQFNRVQA